MSDFNGKPLVLRDDIERAFWGRIVVAEFTRAPDGFARSITTSHADEAVVAMRVRQKFAQIAQSPNERYPVEHTARGCAVCGELAPYQNHAHGDIKHSDGCPLTPVPGA